MSDDPSAGQQRLACRVSRSRGLAFQSAVLALAACVSGQAAFAQMERANARAMAAQSPAVAAVTAANPNMNCSIIIPKNPLTAKGLATPYQLVATNAGDGPCNESNAVQSAFVEAAIINPATGAVSIYDPVVVDQGTAPAVAPVVPKLPPNAIVALWFGFNGNNLTLTAANPNVLTAAKCVNGTPGSIFTQFSECNAPNFFQAADAAIANGQLKVPALATAQDGQVCPTLRNFFIVDQDQSDNLPTKYLLTTNGTIAQNTTANIANLKGATTLANPGDNILLDAFVGGAIGCTPFMANNLADPGHLTFGLALNELQARVDQATPVAMVPSTDPMVLVNNNLSPTKDNLYRNAVDQPLALDAYASDGARYCREMLRFGPARIFNPSTQNLLTNFASPMPTVASTLFAFMTQRFVASYMLLNCPALTGITDPVTAYMNADGVFTTATLNTTAYAQIQTQLKTSQTADFAEDSSANSQLATEAGSASAMCGTGNTLPGAAANYGVFIVGNGSATIADSQMSGSLAVGGGATIANYAVASGVASGGNIFVGGQLTAANGGVGANQQGTIFFENGAPQLTGFTAGGGATASTAIDFNAAAAYYQSAATALGAQAPNGTTTICDGCINFTGTNTTLNVFTVSGAALGNANEIAITVPPGSAVVINVTGNTAKFQNGAVVETGATAATVLWNFPSPTNITLVGSMDPMGTILAPFSYVNGGFGAMTGQLIAATLVANTSFNDVQYACTLPIP